MRTTEHHKENEKSLPRLVAIFSMKKDVSKNFFVTLQQKS